MHQILTPFFLRRLKSDVELNVPPKREVIVYAPLTPRQRHFYERGINRTLVGHARSLGKAETLEMFVGDSVITQEEIDAVPEPLDRNKRSTRNIGSLK